MGSDDHQQQHRPLPAIIHSCRAHTFSNLLPPTQAQALAPHSRTLLAPPWPSSIYTHTLLNDLSSTQRPIKKQADTLLSRSPHMDQDQAKPSPPPAPLPRSLSAAVTYCCGACGYDLNLSSSARDTAGGVGGRVAAAVAFGAIDDDRFGHLDEFRCLDVRARRLFARRTRLLCRKCGAHLGFGYDDTAAARRPPRYLIKIRALHPTDPRPPSDHDAPLDA